MSRDDSTAEEATAATAPTAEATDKQDGSGQDGAGPEKAGETSSGTSEGQAGADEEAQKPKRAKPKATNARKTRTVELTLTVTGTADGEWQAELKQGSKWMARGLDVPAAAVSRAAKELHDELSAPIDEIINAAREQQQARVAQLEAELEQARQTLANLDED